MSKPPARFKRPRARATDNPQNTEKKPPKKKRFDKAVEVEAKAGGYAVTLDGKVAKTPGRRPMLLPTPTSADLVARAFSDTDRVDKSGQHARYQRL